MKDLLVIGNGMVGHRLVQAVRDRDTTGTWRITVLGEETRAAYDRVALSSYVDGTSAEELTLPELDVTMHLGDPAVEIDRDARAVRTAGGHRFAYDALVLATGSVPFVPPVPGRDLPNCFVYRTLDDLDAITAAAATAMAAARPGRRSAVVVGGGLLGLEAARALRSLGLSPQVVEIAPRLMPVQVDEGGGALLRRLVESEDLTVRCGVSVTGITEDRGRLVAGLSDGVELDADVVVFSAGIRPADALARAAGLAVGERGGVLVDDRCRTRDDAIWAVGEVAALEGRTYGLVAPGYAMAEVVADRLLGGQATMVSAEIDMSTQLKMLGVDVASFGDAHATTPDALEVVVNDPVAGTYAKLVVSDDARTLLGGVLVGDASKYGTLRALVGQPLPADPVALIAPGGVELGADALPDSAQICTCNAVTKGAICSAIDGGAHDVPALKACTRAGTSCGSCVPTLKKLLTQQGVEVSKALCEHFDQSRAELFEIVAGTGIRTFSELVARYGSGRGCDICKPAVASILASLGERARARRRAGHPAGHQRPLPREHAAQRHLLGGAAHPRRRDHAGGPDRHRRGRPRLRALHEDHRRAADRPVRRPRRAAPGDLAAARRRRVRVGARLRQVAAHGEVVRRHAPGAATACRTRSGSPSRWSCGTGACGPRTSSSRGCRAARGSARRPARRTSGSSPPRTAGTSTSAATAGSPRATPSCSRPTWTPRRWSGSSTGSSCSTSAPPTGCSAPRPGSRPWTAGSTTSAR